MRVFILLLLMTIPFSCHKGDQTAFDDPQSTNLGIFSSAGVQEVKSLPASEFKPWMEQIRGAFLLGRHNRVYAAISGLGLYSFSDKTISKPSVMNRRLFGEPFSFDGKTVYWTRAFDLSQDALRYAFFTGLPGDTDFDLLDVKGVQDSLPLDFIGLGDSVLGHWKNEEGAHTYQYWQSAKQGDAQIFLNAGNPGILESDDPFLREIRSLYPQTCILMAQRDFDGRITGQSMIESAVIKVPELWTKRKTATGIKILTGTRLLGFDAKGKMTVLELPLLKPGTVYTDFFVKDDTLYLLWEERQKHLTGVSGFLVIEHVSTHDFVL